MGFQLGAIAVLLVFYGCYLGKMMTQRRQGIQTDQMGKGKAGKTKAIELTMKTATFLVLIVEVISIWRSASSMPPAMRVIGFVLAVCGDVVFIVCSDHARQLARGRFRNRQNRTRYRWNLPDQP